MAVELLGTFVAATWVILPAYLANSSAVLTGGHGVVDGGRTWRGERLLGDGKTWSGLIGGTAIGTVAGLALQLARAPVADAGIAVPDYGAFPALVILPLATALGALLGDMAASFVKRRIGKARGEPWPGVDQFDFLAGALLVAGATSWAIGSPWFVDAVTLPVLVLIVVATPLVHLGANALSYRMGHKEVPW